MYLILKYEDMTVVNAVSFEKEVTFLDIFYLKYSIKIWNFGHIYEIAWLLITVINQ